MRDGPPKGWRWIGRQSSPERCSRATVITFTGGELKWDTNEKECADGCSVSALEGFRGNSNYKDYGIRWLVLSAVDTLEKDKDMQLLMTARWEN